jgi:hypothetical protein
VPALGIWMGGAVRVDQTRVDVPSRAILAGLARRSEQHGRFGTHLAPRLARPGGFGRYSWRRPIQTPARPAFPTHIR